MASQTCAAAASDDSLDTNINADENSKVPVKEELNDLKKIPAKQVLTSMFTSEQQQQLFQQKLEEQRFRTQLMREEFEAEQIRLDELHKLKVANERRLAEEQIFELKDARLKEEKRLEELHQIQLQNERNRGQQALYNLQAANKRAVTHDNELHKLKEDATRMNIEYDSNPLFEPAKTSTSKVGVHRPEDDFGWGSTSKVGVNRLEDDFGWGDWGTTKKKKKKITLPPAYTPLTETLKAPNPPLLHHPQSQFPAGGSAMLVTRNLIPRKRSLKGFVRSAVSRKGWQIRIPCCELKMS
ncbi:hypothetical protein B0J14DRAFT_637319 [Halenospora varia]|nr:hypothetical protein B0J14DRAFT_637319 [Halenospora varia]